MLLCIEGTTPTDGAEKLSFHFKFLKSASFRGPDVRAGKWPQMKIIRLIRNHKIKYILSVLVIIHLIPWQ